MSGSLFLPILVVAPLVGALVVALLPKDRPALAKQVALGWSLAILAVVVVMWTRFDPGGDRFQFRFTGTWIKAWDANFTFATDGIALVMLALIALLVPVVILASWDDAENSRRSVPTYFALMLALESTMLGVLMLSALGIWMLVIPIELLGFGA